MFYYVKFFVDKTFKFKIKPSNCNFICTFYIIFVNSSRIIVSIVVQNQASYYMSNNPHTVIHEIIGIIINLSFLILIYFLAEYFLNKIKHNEKLT